MKTNHESNKWATIRTLGLAALGALLFMCFFFAMMIGSSAESLQHADWLKQIFLR